MAAPWGTVNDCSWSGVERILLSTHGVRNDEFNEMAGRVRITWCRRVCAPYGMLDRVDRHGAARILRGEIVFGLPAYVVDDHCLVVLPLVTVHPARHVVLHILHPGTSSPGAIGLMVLIPDDPEDGGRAGS